MSETALYYTLSTVSQTLAGALGMLAAFLAIRASALDAAIRENLAELEKRAGGPTVRPVSGRTSDALKLWGERAAKHGWTGADLVGQLLERAAVSNSTKTRLLNDAQRAFVVSTVVMGACFVGLASTPWLSCTWPRAWTTGAVVILGGVACLVWYGRIVRAALE